ncbi:hypothetical protein BDA99DRAFT_559072 [Phascolomyces articulosus]|uniref:Uncharacterized protein n=1 Tax=Phascolomyces articulosus TaxID=60185 RepID=A0AAD5KBG1_9FUNG|nr:hypothetical protein BDA99DRAFT_559072 [Phascolomyces articulosus]
MESVGDIMGKIENSSSEPDPNTNNDSNNENENENNNNIDRIEQRLQRLQDNNNEEDSDTPLTDVIRAYLLKVKNEMTRNKIKLYRDRQFWVEPELPIFCFKNRIVDKALLYRPCAFVWTPDELISSSITCPHPDCILLLLCQASLRPSIPRLRK